MMNFKDSLIDTGLEIEYHDAFNVFVYPQSVPDGVTQEELDGLGVEVTDNYIEGQWI